MTPFSTARRWLALRVIHNYIELNRKLKTSAGHFVVYNALWRLASSRRAVGCWLLAVVGACWGLLIKFKASNQLAAIKYLQRQTPKPVSNLKYEYI